VTETDRFRSRQVAGSIRSGQDGCANPIDQVGLEIHSLGKTIPDPKLDNRLNGCVRLRTGLEADSHFQVRSAR